MLSITVSPATMSQSEYVIGLGNDNQPYQWNKTTRAWDLIHKHDKDQTSHCSICGTLIDS